MNAIILSIGDELVLGQTVDTNSAWLSQQLAAVGCEILAHATVPDDQPSVERAIREAVPECDYLIISGGIGPTEDDLTRQALAAVMKQPLDLSQEWLTVLRGFWEKRGRPMPEMNRIQAMIPRGANMIHNHAGTAAGIHATLSEFALGSSPATHNSQLATRNCDVFIMPGVPKEMKLMFEKDVLPHIQKKSAGAIILSRTLHTFGLGESNIAEKLGPLMNRTRNPSVGTTVSSGVVSLRVNARFPSRFEAEKKLADTETECRRALGDLIYGADDQTLPQIVGDMLKSKSQSVATAESCTGGLLAKMLTDLSGSSDYFKFGWVTYSNEAKAKLLGVNIGPEGAVSEDTVRQMCTNALARAGADYALAISGIAGPTGGTPTKPVGTVCIGLAYLQNNAPGTITRTFVFPGDREMIRDRSAKMALTLLRYHLLQKPVPF